MTAISRSILKKKNNLKRHVKTLEFDEINSFYQEIEDECRQEFIALYVARYEEVWYWLKGEKPKEDRIDELAELYVARIWNTPHEATHYAFDSEFKRKRDRAYEAIQSVPTGAQKQLEVDKAARFMTQQIGWYADFSSQAAEEKALTDAGVKKVRWMIYGDDRVCDVCLSMAGNVYDIDKVPDRPHLRCRCYLVPAYREEVKRK